MRDRVTLLLVILALSICSVQAVDYRTGSLLKQETQRIYSNDPNDSWNRIFSLLFTHTVQLRLASDFREGAPFVSPGRFFLTFHRPVTISSRRFNRIESGDRATDPLYSFFSSPHGRQWFLTDPQYDQFSQAMKEALAEPVKRPALQRALMQSDIWAAYDILGTDPENERAVKLLGLLAQFVRKLALTPEEISALPHNYVVAQSAMSLPALFDGQSGWIEIEWNPLREHDITVAYRRATRVFLKPAPSEKRFLENLNGFLEKTRGGVDMTDRLDGVALATEDLLVDTDGRVEPSPLIFDMQVRHFAKDFMGKLLKTEVAEYELSRKFLVSDPASGGLVRYGEDDPAYLAFAMNDYGFASAQFGLHSPLPVLSTLRRRCEGCHEQNAKWMLTFPGTQDANSLFAPLPVRQLDPVLDPHGTYVAAQKMQRPGFVGMLQRR